MLSTGKKKSGAMKARRSHSGLKPKSWPTASQMPKKVSRRRKRLVVSLSIFVFPLGCGHRPLLVPPASQRSEEHTSELQSLMRISYAVFCLKQKKKTQKAQYSHTHILN